MTSSTLMSASLLALVLTVLTVLVQVLAALLDRSGPIRLRYWAEEASGRLLGLFEEPLKFEVFRYLLSWLARMATVALFQFIASWNDFNGPLLYLSDPQKFPLAYGLEQFISSYADQTHLLLAAATLFTLPIVLLFLLAQRTFLQGIATTGLKG